MASSAGTGTDSRGHVALALKSPRLVSTQSSWNSLEMEILRLSLNE